MKIGNVTRHLICLIKKNVNDYSIVVWYDPEKVYEPYIDSFDFGSIPLYKYTDSFFRLRKEIDGHIEKLNACIVYIPLHRKRKASPLIEAECAGTILEPGADKDKNTRLEVIARNALTDVLPVGNIDEICATISQGALSLADLDTIADKGKNLGKEILNLVFGTPGFDDVTLKFLSTDEYDSALIEKKGENELMGMIDTAYGFKTRSKKLDKIRSELGWYILITDFLSNVKDDSVAAAFDKTNKAEKNVYIQACKNIAKTWRNRNDIKDSYLQAAGSCEKSFDIGNINLKANDIIECDTFGSLEPLFVNSICEMIMNDEYEKSVNIIKQRAKSFWVENDPVGMLRWNLLSHVTNCLMKIDILSEDIKTINSISAMFEKYTRLSDDGEGWYEIDYYYRLAENNYANYDESDSEIASANILKIIVKLRDRYIAAIEKQNKVFQKLIIENGYSIDNNQKQTNIYKTYVSPKIKKKTAYILVDALRYEMGVELFNSINSLPDSKVSLNFAVSTVPCITDFGMASLLPSAEKKIKLAQSNNKIYPKLDGEILDSRNKRVKWFKNKINKNVCVLKLENIIKPRKTVEDKINESDIIIITSQEIDLIGEQSNPELSKKIINDILGELNRGLKSLARLGIEHFVVSADHGYLMMEKLPESMKIDVPGGNTVMLDKRFWCGHGGADKDTYFRIKGSELYNESDVDFLFPNGISLFKAQGSSNLSYFHGGISLQELVIPVIEIESLIVRKDTDKSNIYRISIDREKITNKFFTFKVKYENHGMFPTMTSKIRVSAIIEKKECGKIVSAGYGFDQGTGEIELKKDEENPVTILIFGEFKSGTMSIHVYDSETNKELNKLKDLEVAITF